MNAIIDVIVKAWGVFQDMAPYLLFGFLVAGILSVYISPQLVERHLGGRGFLSVLKASLFGVPLPLCSCGVIPVSASLRRHGASRGATASFLLSTPQTGVDSILATYALLGPVLAVFRPLASLFTGLFGGVLVDRLADKDPTAAGDTPREEARCLVKEEGGDCCAEGCEAHSGAGGRLRRIFSYGFVTLPRDIGHSLLFGILLAGLIGALVPAGFFADRFGEGWAGMLIMMLFGLPLYVCATASIPIAAAMMAKGVSAGAALVFLIVGPATNAATISTIYKVLGRRTAAIYLGTAAVCALLSGWLLDWMLDVSALRARVHEVPLTEGWVGTLSALALVLILANAMRPRRAGHEDHEHAPDTTPATKTENASAARLRIEGMTCPHCATSLRQTLEEMPGIGEVTVDHEAGTALVHGNPPPEEKLREAVESLGYSLVALENEA